MEQKTRLASHAGSWYSEDGTHLDQQLSGWLTIAKTTDDSARGIISPHAGYSYSGPPAAYGFKNMDKNKIKRVFVIGPSHHHYFTRCALSKMDRYDTPLGDIILDKPLIDTLHATGKFDWMSKSVDEDEHSIEMQLPYIRKMMGDRPFTLVPILVGSTDASTEKAYGELLSPYLDDETNFFVISSDFCHWGKRFNYFHYDESEGEIYESIEKLDRDGMTAIETLQPDGFYAYLKKTKNTICGRHPIGIFMQMIKAAGNKQTIRFVHYAQSSKCMSQRDSSVSYAVGVSSSK
ncbi:hypothetical protein PROFUN_02961 [Planoprotostelium fungivorum]|uniref:Protein MEMO1 n=1 Tax=Planoprotostelium fungivorum TaxID=1890364 RepID=A0A2P6NX61_9EUKA|nr:hypothetical protein PROFUN_02961 [Planoprotostelium fungivorum]